VIRDISAICCSSQFLGEVGVLNNTNIFFCSLCVYFFSVISVVQFFIFIAKNLLDRIRKYSYNKLKRGGNHEKFFLIN
jgi:hypothetical protein